VPAVPASTPCPAVRNEPCRPYLPAKVPTGVTATVDSTGTGQASWTAPAGPAPDNYVITPSTGLAVATVGPQTTAGVGYIAHGVPVTFTVQAIYSGVTGPASDASLSVIDAGTRLVPMTPTRLLDTRAGSGYQVFPALAGAASGDLPLNGVSAAAEAVVLNVTVTAPTAGGFLTVYPTGEARPNSSNLNFVPGQTVANLVTVKVGAGHSVTVFNSLGSTDVVVDIVGYYSGEHAPIAATYTARPPLRVLDTRPGAQHLGFPTLTNGGKGNLVVRGGGTTGVPPAATAVVLNVTATAPTAEGFVTAYPTAVAPNTPPLASSLNYVPGQTVANLVTVQIGDGGSITLFNSLGNTDLVADVVGYFKPGDATGGTFHPLSPTRVLDTRPASGHQVFPALGSGQHQDLIVANGSVVPSAASSVLVNLTATGVTADGYLTAYPTATEPNNPPLASNLNFTAGQTVPNLASIKVGLAGKISIFNFVGSADVVVDLAGWYG